MAPGIDRRSMDLLEWLHDHPGRPVTDFPSDSSSPQDELRELIGYLADRRLVKDRTTFGGVDAEIRPDGAALVQRVRTARAAPTQRARRAAAVQTHLLWWLDSQDTRPASVADALADLRDDDLGTPFAARDIDRAAGYLFDKGLITGHRTWQSQLLRPELTHDGRTCVTDFGGNVSDYLNAVTLGGNTTMNITAGSHNNIAVGNHNVQTTTTGLDTAKVLEFAQFVREVIPALGLSTEQQGVLDLEVQELQDQADSPAAEPGVLRGLITKIVTALGAGTSTAIQTIATGLGEQALESVQAAITSG